MSESELTPSQPAGPSGFRGGPPPTSTPASGKGRGLPKRALLVVGVVLLAAAAYFGYHYWEDQNLFVSTDNAAVAGAMIQVGGLNAGQVTSVAVDIGERVSRDQLVATLTLPSALSSASDGTPKMGFNGTDDQQVQVRAPIDGVVVARLANPGDRVAAGQTLLTVVDPTRLWVQANVEETVIARVRPGQNVQVTLDCVGASVPGQVTAVGGATSSTFSLLPPWNLSGNFTKVTQLVPVKIAMDYGDLPLVLGSSAEVHIRVQE